MYLQMYLQFFKDKNLLVFSKYLKWKRTILSVRFYLKSTEISTTFSNRNFVCLTKRNNKLIQLQQLRDGGALILYPHILLRVQNDAEYMGKIER